MSILLATSQNGVIGKNRQLPWDIPEDLRYIKRVTLKSTCLSGATPHYNAGLESLDFAEYRNLFHVNVFVSNHCHHKHSITSGSKKFRL
ncbi:dihydrofolate reductase [Alicyclobacillus mengziensis]